MKNNRVKQRLFSLQYYRAKIIQTDSHFALVSFIDYGNDADKVLFADLRPLVSHSFIHSFILNFYIAPLQENYSEVLPTSARLKRAVLR